MKITLMIVLAVAAFVNCQDEVHVIVDEREGPVEADFRHNLELSDGTFIEESGAAGSAGQSNKQGSYSYISPDGTPIEIRWVADERGFQPTGDAIPVGPEIPAHVQDLLRIAEQQRAEGIEFDQQGFRINK